MLGDGAERVVLDLLKGREKLKEGRGRYPPAFEASELSDGERRCDRTNGDSGECGIDTALPEDNLRVLEKVDPALELV